MSRRATPTPGDRGFTILDVVVGLMLTALGAALVAHLVTNATRAVDAEDEGAAVALTADRFARDVRATIGVDVDVRRGRVVALDLHTEAETVRWDLRGNRVTRTAGAGGTAQVLLDDLDPTSSFSVLDRSGAPVDPTDRVAVACGRMVRADLIGTPGWSIGRDVALRVAPGEGACP